MFLGGTDKQCQTVMDLKEDGGRFIQKVKYVSTFSKWVCWLVLHLTFNENNNNNTNKNSKSSKNIRGNLKMVSGLNTADASKEGASFRNDTCKYLWFKK